MLPHIVDISAKLLYEVLTSDGGRSGKFYYLVKNYFIAIIYSHQRDLGWHLLAMLSH